MRNEPTASARCGSDISKSHWQLHYQTKHHLSLTGANWTAPHFLGAKLSLRKTPVEGTGTFGPETGQSPQFSTTVKFAFYRKANFRAPCPYLHLGRCQEGFLNLGCQVCLVMTPLFSWCWRGNRSARYCRDVGGPGSCRRSFCSCDCVLGWGWGAQPPAHVPVSGLCNASPGQLLSLQETAKMAVKNDSFK